MSGEMQEDIDKIIITAEEIGKKVEDISQKLSTDYKGKDLTVVAILNGSLVFLSDLIRQLPLSMRLDTIGADTYGAQTFPRTDPRLLNSLKVDVQGRDVLIIDDIIDTGKTLQKVLEDINKYKPRSIKTCVLLNRSDRRQVELEPDYFGFKIGNEFVVGYGLDFNNQYRNLPFIAALKAECYGKR
ncbi:MAG TPA: hypoxanthine phosphoribosyltransferase [Candidatus Hypogeohydataceae bacterium YC41]